jgi:hypothetical protein
MSALLQTLGVAASFIAPLGCIGYLTGSIAEHRESFNPD